MTSMIFENLTYTSNIKTKRNIKITCHDQIFQELKIHTFFQYSDYQFLDDEISLCLVNFFFRFGYLDL